MLLARGLPAILVTSSRASLHFFANLADTSVVIPFYRSFTKFSNDFIQDLSSLNHFKHHLKSVKEKTRELEELEVNPLSQNYFAW